MRRGDSMTFEDDFPSFKEYKKKSQYPMIREGEYEFTDDYINYYIKEAIEECCIDKQRVREAYEEASRKGSDEGHGFDHHLFKERLGL
jgi:hypothetical protein